MIDKINKEFHTTKSTIYDTSSFTMLETIGKFLEKLNELIENLNKFDERVTDVETTKLKEEIENKFKSIILSEEMKPILDTVLGNKINSLLDDGTLANMTIEKYSITLDKLEKYFVDSILVKTELPIIETWKGYINSNGELVLNEASANVLNVLNCENLEYIIIDGISNIAAQGGCALLNENKTVIKAWHNSDNDYNNTFINCKEGSYVVFPKTNASIKASYYKNIKEFNDIINDKIGNTSNKMEITTSKKGFISSGGIFSQNENSTYTTNFWEVKELRDYKIEGKNQEKCANYGFFDENFNLIKHIGGGENSNIFSETLTIPTGVKYVGSTIRDYFCNLYEPTKVKEYIDKNITILDGKYSKWKNKTIWICGTSITMGGGKGKSYIDKVGELLECNIINVAVGGSSICCKLANSTNLYKLPNDFRSAYLCFSGTLKEKNYIYEQQNGGIYDGNNVDLETISNMSYERKLLPYLDGTYQQPDLFIIEHGGNDLRLMSNEVYNPSNPYDMTNYYGCMNFIIKLMYEKIKNPNIMILGHYENQSEKRIIKSGYDDYGARTIASRKEVSKKQEIIADLWGLPFCKTWEQMGASQMKIKTKGRWKNGIWKDNYYSDEREITMLEYLIPDGTHPHSDLSGYANMKLAKILTNFIKNTF